MILLTAKLSLSLTDPVKISVKPLSSHAPPSLPVQCHFHLSTCTSILVSQVVLHFSPLFMCMLLEYVTCCNWNLHVLFQTYMCVLARPSHRKSLSCYMKSLQWYFIIFAHKCTRIRRLGIEKVEGKQKWGTFPYESGLHNLHVDMMILCYRMVGIHWW